MTEQVDINAAIDNDLEVRATINYSGDEKYVRVGYQALNGQYYVSWSEADEIVGLFVSRDELYDLEVGE